MTAKDLAKRHGKAAILFLVKAQIEDPSFNRDQHELAAYCRAKLAAHYALDVLGRE